MSKTLPITPQQAKEHLVSNFPEFVIKAVNNAINNNFYGKPSFTIKKKEIENEILKLAPEGTARAVIYEKHWLDFEDHYKRFGWKVSYESPDRGENFDEYFKFSIA